jgi:uncharacterized membrane protein YfcA
VIVPQIDPLYSLSGFFVGMLVGQTGMGGGSLMTPILVLFFHVHPATAVGTDLLYACVTKMVGTLVHGMHQTVDWRMVRRLALGSVPATLLTLVLISQVDMTSAAASQMISVVLGIMLLLTAVSLLLRRRFLGKFNAVMENLPDRTTASLTVAVGVALGVLVTISSVGAGAIGGAALLLLYPTLPMALIVGTDIAHAVPLTLIAGAGHLWLGSVDWMMLVSLLSGSIPGIIIGSYFSARVPDRVLRPILAVTLIVVGGRLVI